MNILNKIIKEKIKEVDELKELYPVKLLERSIYFDTQAVSLKEYLKKENASGIIAEFKRKSPSKAWINKYADVEKVTLGYMQAGASALSVLTDKTFFGGSNDDLTKARKFNFCPILRKDFIIEEYQIYEAKSIGADAILLIAEVLDKTVLKNLAKKAHELGLEVLMEIHSEKQLNKLNEFVDVLGVNNRDLETFEVSLEKSKNISKLLPSGLIKISESGIHAPEDVNELKGFGFDGFLIGERFMSTPRPQEACKNFIRKVSSLR
ncbi:MAG TPA: indole-3-glycerol phosphate synthase TrpC [Bacteroidetes bacterium]|nr:indole-3-glycerol phosphate synthase TrpC [Bacteroidota bacterium]